jgi:hypothetical protein
LLSLSPARGPRSPILNLRSSFGSNLFKDWPEANDMAAIINVALTADASSSCALAVNALHCAQKSCIDDSTTRRSHSWLTSL